MTGDGFTPDSDITATFDGTSLSLVGTAHTDSSGHFEVTFIVPSVALGPYTVTATDDASYSASATFAVTITPVPENPIGVFVSVAAIGLAFVAWRTVKRAKSPAKPAFSI
jgi:purine-cytosine permease-like protein